MPRDPAIVSFPWRFRTAGSKESDIFLNSVELMQKKIPLDTTRFIISLFSVALL